MDKLTKVLRVLASVIILVALGCARSTETESIKSGPASRALSRTETENPFSGDEGADPTTVATCLKLSIDIRHQDDVMQRSSVRVENRCTVSVALLTSPAEVRIRRDHSDRYPHQLLPTAAHATFYVVSAAVGLGSDMFIGDGGRLVYAAPTYTCISTQASMEIPILDAQQLLPETLKGTDKVVVALATAAVTLDSQPCSITEPFDLRINVDSFNAARRDTNSSVPFRLTRRAQWLFVTGELRPVDK